MLIATHAVGDLAVSRVLDVYAGLPPREGLPFHSIEHLEILSDADVEQPRCSPRRCSRSTCSGAEDDDSDNWAVRPGSERAATGFRVRGVLDAGVRLVLGSDWPVAQYDPRIGMAWARGRHTPGAPRRACVRARTALERRGGAAGLHALAGSGARGHDDRGVLAVGVVGDLTVWGADPVEASPDESPDVPILLTVVDGRVVHEG